MESFVAARLSELIKYSMPHSREITLKRERERAKPHRIKYYLSSPSDAEADCLTSENSFLHTKLTVVI